MQLDAIILRKYSFRGAANSVLAEFRLLEEKWPELRKELTEHLSVAWEGKGGDAFAAAVDCLTAGYYQTAQGLSSLMQKATYAYNHLQQIDESETGRYRKNPNLLQA